ncbi:MAG: radical SAM protein [Candidatus Gracilibacteria bacterium]
MENIYQNADLIVQTTKGCTMDCKGCYLAKPGKSTELDTETYRAEIAKLQKGNVVALRGGEITKINNWFAKFVAPAIKMGLMVVIESNGHFIEANNYNEVLEGMKNPAIDVNISCDKIHLGNKNPAQKEEEFAKMARFASDATERGINFGFYALMSTEEIPDFVEGTALAEYLGKFHALPFYADISQVSLHGKYLNCEGRISDKIPR